jgi:predicted ATPase
LITKLVLGNFQGFGPNAWIPLSNVSLIFGPNSSGKSSVFRALRVIAQSLNQKKVPGRFASFEFSGELVDLGGFENTVNGQDSSKSISLGVQLSQSDSHIEILGIEWEIESTSRPSGISIDGVYSLNESKTEFKTFKIQFELTMDETLQEVWTLSEKSRSVYKKMHLTFSRFEKTLNRAAQQENEMAPLLRSLFRPSSTPGMVMEMTYDAKPATVGIWRERLRGKASTAQVARFSTDRLVPTEINESYSSGVSILAPSLQHALDVFYARLSESLERLHYVGPLRPVPDKLVGSLGYASSEEASLTNKLAQNSELREAVSKHLNQLTNGIYELEWWPVLREKKQAFKHLPHLGALLIHDKNNDTRVTFSDVGVGLSQLLPILAKLVQLEKKRTRRGRFSDSVNGTLLAEQPELHLHPRMQSELAEFFAKIATKKQNPVQILAETHSESMLLRLQSLIRTKKINVQTVQVLYAQRVKSTKMNAIKPLLLNPAGDFIEKWPQSFSELRFEEFF